MKKIKFTQIPVQLAYPRAHKAVLSTWHSQIVERCVAQYDGTSGYRQDICNLMNIITAKVLSGDTIPKDMSIGDLAKLLASVDFDETAEACGDLCLDPKDIEWDVEPVESPLKKYTPEQLQEKMAQFLEQNNAELIAELAESEPQETSDSESSEQSESLAPAPALNPAIASAPTSAPTPKEDLYFSSCTVPAFDKDKVWFSGFANECEYAVYTSLPEIPRNQSEITITTDIRKLRDADVMKLFPNRRIRTRPDCMYEPLDGVEMHPILGLVLPIDGFTRKQIIENMVSYPFFHNPRRFVGKEIRSIYDDIEINGELVRTVEIWDELPISKIVPKTKEFMREYVARRFYLERDVQNIEHRYKTLGTYLPFATLFTTPEEYKALGYNDALDLAWKCVKHRIFYHQTASPVLRACGAEPKSLEECIANCKS